MRKKQTGTVRRVLQAIRRYRFSVVLSILFAAASVVLILYAPILTGRAVDQILGPGRVDFGELKKIIFEFLIVVAATAIAQWIMNILNNRIAYRVVQDVRCEAFSHLARLPVGYIDAHGHGDIVSRIVADIDQFSDGLLMGFSQLFTGVVTIFGTLFFMLFTNWQITIVVVVITPLSLFVARFIAKHTYEMAKLQSETRGELTSFVNEMIDSQKIVKAFGHEAENIETFCEINDRLAKHSLRATFYSSLTNPSTRFVNGLVYAGVGIAGAIAAIHNMLTVGQLTMFLSYANQYTKPFNEISGVITELQTALASAARVFALIDEPGMKAEPEDMPALTETDGRVDIENVAFSYTPDQDLITGLNLHVEPGQRVAIVGPTGCGKSTVINLLMRFYDADSGDIRVSGHSIYEITRHSLREHYGMVLQETWLKSGTIRENIAYGKPDASEEEIVRAAKEAHAHSFIKRMPKGYDTELTEDGGNLSGGQKQLLCIARVMLSLPPMLILDEATSSIDTRTEIRIQRAFTKMMQGRTSFIVAHRLSTIREADMILVMKDGHIIEQGTHQSLLAKNGFYAELYNSQFELS